MGRVVCRFVRVPPSSRRVVGAGMSLGVLILAAVALAFGAHANRPARHVVRTVRSARPQARTVAHADFSRAQAAARRFLAGYLRFAYGHAPASSVQAATPALLRQLSSERAGVTPVERHRDPRVVSLVVAGQARSEIAATALVSDGGIVNYAVRLALHETPSGWLVSSVDNG